MTEEVETDGKLRRLFMLISRISLAHFKDFLTKSNKQTKNEKKKKKKRKKNETALGDSCRTLFLVLRALFAFPGQKATHSTSTAQRTATFTSNR